MGGPQWVCRLWLGDWVHGRWVPAAVKWVWMVLLSCKKETPSIFLRGLSNRVFCLLLQRLNVEVVCGRQSSTVNVKVSEMYDVVIPLRGSDPDGDTVVGVIETLPMVCR